MPKFRTTFLRTLFVVSLWAGACATTSEHLERPADLPDRIVFQTPTESFNKAWYLALRNGRMWIKPNPDTSLFEGDWEPLGGDGLPSGCGLVRFGPPSAIQEISIDGIHLMALSTDGVFYRAENSMKDLRNWVQWDDLWGWPAGTGDGLTVEFATDRGWSVGDSNALDVEYYEDIRGDRHNVRLGVAHIYRLSPDGRKIHYNDWWLPNDWSRQIGGPERGTFEAVNIRVSGSTIFVIGRNGALYTRLWDFDTSGESDLLTYSYINEVEDDNIRALPAEDWRRQPDIGFSVTKRIAIFQTGKGNSSRTLRVEGVKDGKSGFFYKEIYDNDWKFEALGQAIVEPFLNNEPPSENGDAIPLDRFLTGTLSRENEKTTLEIEMVDFNLFCSPASVYIVHDGEIVTANGEPLAFAFHHVHAMHTETRPLDYIERGAKAPIRGALLIPSEINEIDSEEARERVQKLVGEREVINLAGTATRSSIDLQEIPITTPFLVPLKEKGTPFYLFSLKAE